MDAVWIVLRGKLVRFNAVTVINECCSDLFDADACMNSVLAVV